MQFRQGSKHQRFNYPGGAGQKLAQHNEQGVPVKKADAITIVAAGAAAVAAMLLASPDAHSNPGDSEGDPSYSCVMDGNHVCGPNNPMGAVPGLYDNGTLVSMWPIIRSCTISQQGNKNCADQYVDPRFVVIVGKAIQSAGGASIAGINPVATASHVGGMLPAKAS